MASFDTGIEMAIQRILSDPEFAFRKEIEPAGLAVGKTYRISDMELASRLSFFLWSSIPDDELINLAARTSCMSPLFWSNRCGACCPIPARTNWWLTSPGSG